MRTARFCRWAIALHALLALFVYPWGAAGQTAQARISIRLFPIGAAARSPAVKIEMSDPIARSGTGIRSLTLINTSSGPQITTFATRLPGVRIGGALLSPTYGDQSWSADFLAASLTGLKMEPSAVRGLSLATAGPRSSVTFFVGQLNPSRHSLLKSAIPGFMALTGNFKSQRGWMMTPRLVAPLGRRSASGGAEMSAGVGIRRQLATHVHVIGDLGTARALPGRWARFAAAGLLAQWSRGGFEANASRAGDGFRILDTVAFAGERRELLRAHVLLGRGIKLAGHLSARPRVDQPLRTRRATTGSLMVEIEQLPAGDVRLTMEQAKEGLRRSRVLTAEWHQRDRMVVRFVREQTSNAAAARPAFNDSRVHFEIRGSTGASERLVIKADGVLGLRASEQHGRLISRVSGHWAPTQVFRLSGEASLNLLGRQSSGATVRGLRLTTDFTVSRDLGLQLVYDQQPGIAVARRFEGRLTRVVRF